MTLQIHNTLLGKKENFTPLNPNRVTMYVCGPTVYDYVHIGNARPVVVFDTLFRVLKENYSEVIYARNITDVDDKINKAAKENNETIGEFAERYAAAYHEDMAALYNLTPSIEPRATQNIESMLAMIEVLINKGNAYEAEGHVLFHVPSMPNYGKLSKRSVDDMIAGARVEVAPYKKHPADFVLWKPSTDDLPGWESPWGRGRPGWHIECSAMIRKHLGSSIDIHGGGQDLIFPHHENEIAQGTCSCDDGEYVRYWMHNGYVTIDGEKMSKSLGNFTTIRELLKRYDGEVLRFALLGTHYRSPLHWSEDLLQQAYANLERFYLALREVQHLDISTDVEETVAEGVKLALYDDLNTPKAIAELHSIVNALNKSQDEQEKKKLKKQLLVGAGIMGLLTQEPENFLQNRKTNIDGVENKLSKEKIDSLIHERSIAKKEKNYSKADEIRDRLASYNIELEDSKEGTRWRYTL